MQEMLYPTSYLKSMNLGKACALITDGRFSGGTAGLSIGHVSPEAAAGGDIALIKNGDIIEIDIPGRSINVKLSAGELKKRRDQEKKKGNKAFRPVGRKRTISDALRAYAYYVSSADRGAVRIVPDSEASRPRIPVAPVGQVFLQRRYPLLVVLKKILRRFHDVLLAHDS